MGRDRVPPEGSGAEMHGIPECMEFRKMHVPIHLGHAGENIPKRLIRPDFDMECINGFDDVRMANDVRHAGNFVFGVVNPANGV